MHFKARKIRWQQALAGMATVLCLASLLMPAVARAQDDEPPERETKKVQSMSKAIYEKLTAAQEQLDANNYNGALRTLNSVNQSKVTNYEVANLLNFYGYVYYSQGDNAKAIQSYEKLIKQPDVEIQMLNQTTFTLASLHAQNENWDKTIAYLNDWFATATNPSPEAYILLASAYQSQKKYRETITAVNKAIEIARKRETAPKESWWNLLYYSYYQLEDYKNVRDVLKTLIRGWPKKAYWLQLGAIYSELGDEKNFLAAYEAAFEQGMLETEGELVTYAQLLLQQEVPFKAASVLEESMKNGKIKGTEKNYRLLSQSLTLAQEDQKAIGPLQQAARQSKEGELNVRLAIAFLNLDQHGNCVDAARAGLKKGGVKKPNDARMTIGQCLYNQNKYSSARKEFQQVARGGGSKDKKIAQQWIRVIDSDVARLKQLEDAIAQK